MKFMCLAYEDAQTFDELSQSDWRLLRAEVLDYVAGLRASGRLIDTRPLQRADTASTVRVRDGRRLVSDGPFVETKEQIGGFFLIEARGMDEAIEIAAGWPSARIGAIEVRPVDEGLNEDRRYAPSPRGTARKSPNR